MTFLDVGALWRREDSARETQPRQPGRLLASRAVTAPDARFVVELRPLNACADLVDPWLALARRAIEPNVFLEPGFVLPMARHLPDANGHAAVLVWDRGNSTAEQLIGFWAMRPPYFQRPAGLVAGTDCRYASNGAPLLDGALAVEAASAMFARLAALNLGAGLLFRELHLDGAAARALRAAASWDGRATSELDVYSRPCLRDHGSEDTNDVDFSDVAISDLAASEDAHPDAPFWSRPRYRERMRRQARRLAQHGDVRLVSVTEPAAVRDAIELYLGLEASGWKAARGTAILCKDRDTAFYRCMSRALSQRGQIAVHLLEVGSRVAAAGIVLSSGDHAWFVKASYDEALARCSPGLLATHLIAETSMTKAKVALLDTCCAPGTPAFDRAWTERMRIGDLAIGLDDRATAAIGRNMARRRARRVLKRCYYQLRGWPLAAGTI